MAQKLSSYEKAKRAEKKARAKLATIAREVHTHAESFGHDMLWNLNDLHVAVGTCRHCSTRVEVKPDRRRKMHYANEPKQCPGERKLPTFTDRFPIVFGNDIPATKHRPMTRAALNAPVRMMPTPDPRGFPKASPIVRVVEDAKVFGVALRNTWDYDRELDTRPRAVKRRKQVAENSPRFEMRTTTRK